MIDKLLPLLGDSDPDVRAAAAGALGTIPAGDRAGAVIDKLLPLLGNKNLDVRAAAAGALVAISASGRAGAVINKLLPLLGDRGPSVRAAAAEALATISAGDRAGAVIDKLLPLLRDNDSDVRGAAAGALATISAGDRAGAVIDKLLPLLEDNDRDVRKAATQALTRHGPGGASAFFVAARLIYVREASATGWLRAAAHIATGADARKERTETLLAWLGRPTSLPLTTVSNNPAAAHNLLDLFLRHWTTIAATPDLRKETEDRVMDIVYAACRTPAEAGTPLQWMGAVLAWLRDLPFEGPVHRCWAPGQKRTVERLLDRFREQHSIHERALADHLARENVTPIYKWLTWSLAGWALFWAAFLFAFPWSRTVQAVFFWNPRIRGLLSLWFIPLLLLAVPPLRRRLLAPFHKDLVAAARIGDFPQLGFYGRTRTLLDGASPSTVEKVLPGLHGTVVVRGDAGLGKTSALRWIAANAGRPLAFLPARDCADGVDVAIARLIHDVQDTGFMRSMVYTGTLIVIVDGLNEVSADTREKIGSFARDMSKGDILIGTQPIEWQPPPRARMVDLMPLNRSEAEQFLLSRPVGSDETQKRHGAAYAEAVSTFLRRALDEAPTEEDRRAAELMLSNPFDLAFAADLLAQGGMPSATTLIDEAFRLADEGAPGEPGHRSVTGQPFPLVRFGRHAVAMRLEDRNWFKPDEFAAETSSLLRRRLLVRRAVKGADGTEERVQFRHDRVWDFFIAAAFSADPDLWAEHLADPRFRGAYLRIAETWDPSSATRVRDQLIVIAAERGDHTTSDEFIKRLEARRRAKKRRSRSHPSALDAPMEGKTAVGS